MQDEHLLLWWQTHYRIKRYLVCRVPGSCCVSKTCLSPLPRAQWLMRLVYQRLRFDFHVKEAVIDIMLNGDFPWPCSLKRKTNSFYFVIGSCCGLNSPEDVQCHHVEFSGWCDSIQVFGRSSFSRRTVPNQHMDSYLPIPDFHYCDLASLRGRNWSWHLSKFYLSLEVPKKRKATLL